MSYNYSGPTGKVRDRLLEKKKKIGAKFILQLRKGERVCVKPSGSSALLVPFKERK